MLPSRRRSRNPRLLIYLASHDVASIICRAFVVGRDQGARAVLRHYARSRRVVRALLGAAEPHAMGDGVP